MRQKIRSLAYISSGHIFLVVGAIGVFLPVLPTTPFVLLAAFCYERGSPQLHILLIKNPYVGPHLHNWKRHRSIPLRAKIIAVTMITLSIGWVVYAAPLLLVKILMATIGVSVSVYILTRPTTKKCTNED